MTAHVISIPIRSSKLHDLEQTATIVEIANGTATNQGKGYENHTLTKFNL